MDGHGDREAAWAVERVKPQSLREPDPATPWGAGVLSAMSLRLFSVRKFS